MIKAVVHTQQYFQAPEHYFWRWGENGSVIEWNSGSTICYRDDLVALLTAITDKGLPPFGSLLLLLSACREEFSIHHKFFLLRGIKDSERDNKELYALIDKAVAFSKIIFALPHQLKTGTARIHLVQEVFTQEGFVFSNLQVKESVAELAAGRLDALLFTPGQRISQEQFTTDIRHFAEGIERFPDTDSLALKLRTGLNMLPQPLPVEMPEEPSSSSLLDQLANDPQTAGLARLTRRLVAALVIPLHSQNSGDQSYGGITDITNRGNYDKLLLSELAHDTDVLMARLVNNEALYFRREEPPDNPKRRRVILVDTTIKLWGVPRVFALATALAFAQYHKQGEVTEAYALGGDTYQHIGLQSKTEVINAMAAMHHALHCGPAMQKALKELSGDDAEFIFITMPGNLLQPAFAAWYNGIRELLDFMVTTDRDGQFAFYACRGGRNKILNTARFNLDELLFPVMNNKKPGEFPAGNMPAFLLMQPPPMLFPKSRINRSAYHLFYNKEKGVVAVTETWRLLYIANPVKGAVELMSRIEKGAYCFGWGHGNMLHVLVNIYHSSKLIIYTIDINTGEVKYTELPESSAKNSKAVFRDEKFYLRHYPGNYVIDCTEHTLAALEYNDSNMPEFPKYIMPLEEKKLINTFSNYIIQACNIMTKVKKIFITPEGNLAIGNYFLGVFNSGNGPAIMVRENNYRSEGTCYAKEISNNRHYLPNRKLKFGVRQWEDGTEAVVDARGLVHIKSSDRNLPEVSFFLITGMVTACWAADGTVTGNPYFFRDHPVKIIAADIFYNQYIQPVINKIMQA